MDRLNRKWNTAKEMVPGPVFYDAETGDAEARMSEQGSVATGFRVSSSHVSKGSTDGVIFFGTSTDSAMEALDQLDSEDIHLNALRVRAFPSGKAFCEFGESHDRLFVIEQNRDAQFRSLMMIIEFDTDASKRLTVLNYDGTPITADDVLMQVKGRLK